MNYSLSILQYTDYYPYGMLMPGRHGEAANLESNSEVRIIQVAKTTNMGGFLDGAVERSDNAPFYNSSEENKGLGTGFSGNIYWYHLNDFAYKASTEKKMGFTTILVVTNYQGTGANVVLGSFQWGTENFGKTNTGLAQQGKKNTFSKGISPADLKVIKSNIVLLGY